MMRLAAYMFIVSMVYALLAAYSAAAADALVIAFVGALLLPWLAHGLGRERRRRR